MADTVQTSAEPKPLTGRQLAAAQRVAEDLMRDVDIAAEAGVSREALRRWKLKPAFAAEVAARREAIRAESLNYGVANIGSQVQRLNDHRQLLIDIVRQRRKSAISRAKRGPGEDTGLVVKVPKEGGICLEVDTGLLAELRDIELQALKITGQLVNKSILQVTPKMLIGVAIDDV